LLESLIIFIANLNIGFLSSLLIRTNLFESDTIHLHHDIYQVRLNLKRLFKIEQASVKLMEIIPFFLVETLN